MNISKLYLVSTQLKHMIFKFKKKRRSLSYVIREKNAGLKKGGGWIVKGEV